ncbi:helix-turn-helix domain-containing protein [Bacillus mycoides]|uniref:helix-turn-helix domain-containing protein n=1 Tax=Bacillus mycoides TaxID=1405 RepID=UPI000BFCAECE|nr:helix-turn-helix transcriptional regulator [Bacillus mycoides]MCQ6530330.1 helix-turn-helix domain-containing protein [Bacillus mycoides]PGT77827.1 transcriptional regulator [Bacillus cereus]
MEVKIKEVRKQYGDTLQSLAQKINYDYSNLSKVERGIYTPSLDLLNKIAKVYKIELVDLLCISDLECKKEIPLDTKDISNQYYLSVDGEQISEGELKLLLQSVRSFRNTLQQYKKDES